PRCRSCPHRLRCCPGEGALMHRGPAALGGHPCPSCAGDGPGDGPGRRIRASGGRSRPDPETAPGAGVVDVRRNGRGPMTEVSAPRVPVVNPGPLVDPVDALDRDELDRYSRHSSLPGFGVEGQKRLRAASVLVIGAGGLGAPVLNYLAAAGIGSITIIDDDAVETSSLQRQVIHRRVDVGRQKGDSAAAAVHRLDPDLNVTTSEARVSPDSALELSADHDVVLDGADNFATRYLSNDAAELTGTPLVWGTIFRFAGQVSTFAPGHGPMLRDLFPDIPDPDSVPNCAEGGVLGVLCGTV